MAYIVASATEPDAKFETYEEACGWAQSMRNFGVESVIIDADAPWAYWDVWKTGMTRSHVVSARSADEALIVARSITHDKELNSVQRRELLEIEVTKPDGKTEIVYASGIFYANMYIKNYEAQGCKVRML